MRLVTTILILLVMASAAWGRDKKTAQAPDGSSNRETYFSGDQRKREKIIKEELALTDEQGRQWQTLNEALETRAKEILQNKALTPAQKQELFNKAQQDHEKKIKALLTEDQYQKYLQWSAKRRERLRTLRRMEDRQLPGKTAPGKN